VGAGVWMRGSGAARPGEHRFGSRKWKSNSTACKATMCREIARDARGVAMRRLQADPPREQLSRAWRTLEAVKGKIANEIKRHCRLLAEDMEIAPV
jgi:hypothetical protein